MGKNIGSEMQFLKAKSDFETNNKMVEQIRDQLSKQRFMLPLMERLMRSFQI